MVDLEANRTCWQREYSEYRGIPTSVSRPPSEAVRAFWEKVSKSGMKCERALDLGCGLGRNSFFLAENGLEVTSLDFVPEAIQQLKEEATKRSLEDRVHATAQSLSEQWNVEDQWADMAVDIYCYKHLKPEEQAFYRKELVRALRPGGYYLMTTAAIDDAFYAPLLEHSPERENYLVVDPVNKTPFYLCNKDMVLEEFCDHFKFISYQNILRDETIHRVLKRRSMLVFWFQKKPN